MTETPPTIRLRDLLFCNTRHQSPHTHLQPCPVRLFRFHETKALLRPSIKVADSSSSFPKSHLTAVPSHTLVHPPHHGRYPPTLPVTSLCGFLSTPLSSSTPPRGSSRESRDTTSLGTSGTSVPKTLHEEGRGQSGPGVVHKVYGENG